MSCATGIAMGCVVAKLVVEAIHERRALSFAVQAIAATGLVFTLFEFLPHFAVWASEVHLVLGSTLFLLFGAAPAALGLALGLLLQSVLFVPTDLPQYRMNVTTPLIPLFAIKALAKRLIPSKAAYRDLQYSKALSLSTAYQSGIAVWIASLALYRAASAPPTSVKSHRSRFTMQLWPWSSRWLIWLRWRSGNKLGGVSVRGSVAYRSQKACCGRKQRWPPSRPLCSSDTYAFPDSSRLQRSRATRTRCYPRGGRL
nr:MULTISPECIES: energy-coupling factor ABC transporter permease [unclassified Bradyrhizobium]